MPSWLDRLKTNPLDWLLERGCPPIRFRTLTEILGRPPDDPEVRQARDAASSFPPALAIARLQKENGTWLDKLLAFEPPNPSRKRGPGLVNQFLALLEYGWDRSHPIVHCSGERLLRYVLGDSSADLFELKGYVGSNEAAREMIREDLKFIAAVLLSRGGYAEEEPVRAEAERVLQALDEHYPEGGTPDLFEGIFRDEDKDLTYRRIKPGRYVPDMFLYTLMSFHPVFRADERARDVVRRVSDHLMRGDEVPLRVRQANGKPYMKVRDLPIAEWDADTFMDGHLGHLLHDLELLARTGMLPRFPKALDLLERVLALQGEDGVFLVDQQAVKHVTPSQYHYYPLEDSWRGKHKKYTDVAFRVLLILSILDRTCPLEGS